MARMLSQVATIIRGSVGGITYTANQYHNIIQRARVSPVQPQTSYQTMMRSSFVGANNVWEQVLTQSDRDGWDLYAQSCTYVGPLGHYTVPGRQIFVGSRSFQEYIESRGLATPTMVTTPPLITGFYQLKNVRCTTPSGPGTGVAISFTAETLQDCLWMAQISIPFSPTRNRFQGPFLADSAQAGVLHSNTSIVVEFLNLTEDMVYFIRLRAVADGSPPRPSEDWIVRCVAQTVGS